ncbi:hypothetical protein NOCARDAX2BIS_370059 [Nocardioides sp. AX2bis]|nr:hypothetical protein NOCARDAX2BIS_370059 [Nocardioides sp. AX2bis]
MVEERTSSPVVEERAQRALFPVVEERASPPVVEERAQRASRDPHRNREGAVS